MLPRQNRLHKDKDIKNVFTKGRGFFGVYFLGKYYKTPGEYKFTVVVGTKVSKSAVVRNRLKRHLREVIRLNKSKFKEGRYIFTLKPQVIHLGDKAVQNEFIKYLEKNKLINNNVV